MPSKPLLGMPEVVGSSDAVMAMRSTLSCAKAGAAPTAQAANSANRRCFMRWPSMSASRCNRQASSAGLPSLAARGIKARMGEKIERLARFVAETALTQVPAEVQRYAKLVALDTIGVILAGADRPEVR